MSSQNSPNGCWERNGYTIERTEESTGSFLYNGEERMVKRRRIISPDGEVIFDYTYFPYGTSGLKNYHKELQYCKDNNLLLEE